MADMFINKEEVSGSERLLLEQQLNDIGDKEVDVKAQLRRDPQNNNLLTQQRELDRQYKEIARRLGYDMSIDEFEIEDGEDSLSVEFDKGMQYKFDKVVDSQGELQVKEFDYARVFAGMDKETQALVAKADKLDNSKDKYSNTYILEEKAKITEDIKKVVKKYEQKAQEHFNELKSPKAEVPFMTGEGEKLNLLKRLNNTLMFGHLVKGATPDSIEQMFVDNKDNKDVRIMLIGELHDLAQNSKGSDKREYEKLRREIKLYDDNKRHVTYFKELANLEWNLMRIFKQKDSYPTGMTEGVSGVRRKSYPTR